jgi:hypothetical protein
MKFSLLKFMMWEDHANMNKKAISDVIGIVLIITLSLVAIGLIWAYISNTIDLSPEVDCSLISLEKDIFIQRVCYLNDNEVFLKLKRGVNWIDPRALLVKFVGSDVVKFKIDGSVCSDVRVFEKEYHDRCALLDKAEEKVYVFDLSGEGLVDSVLIGIDIGSEKCFFDVREVEESC